MEADGLPLHRVLERAASDPHDDREDEGAEHSPADDRAGAAVRALGSVAPGWWADGGVGHEILRAAAHEGAPRARSLSLAPPTRPRTAVRRPPREPHVSGERLRLMAVHAHPDDESSKGAGTTARYAAEGVDVLVVSCTGGERGDVLNPKYGQVEGGIEGMRAVRELEMAAAAEALGVRQQWLGFVDSGLPEGDPLPPLPEGCFALVPLEEASAPLVELVREFRPHVITTYDPSGGYPHPDHIMCHRVSAEAYAAAGDPERYRGHGEPWTPLKLYYNHGFSLKRMRAVHEAIVEAGRESPFGDWIDSRQAREIPEREVTTRIEVRRLLRPARRRTARARDADRPGRVLLRGPARGRDRAGRPRSTSSRTRACPPRCPRTTCSPGSGRSPVLLP